MVPNMQTSTLYGRHGKTKYLPVFRTGKENRMADTWMKLWHLIYGGIFASEPYAYEWGGSPVACFSSTVLLVKMGNGYAKNTRVIVLYPGKMQLPLYLWR